MNEKKTRRKFTKNLKGDAEEGKTIFKQQGCPTCHSISKGEVFKGPHLG